MYFDGMFLEWKRRGGSQGAGSALPVSQDLPTGRIIKCTEGVRGIKGVRLGGSNEPGNLDLCNKSLTPPGPSGCYVCWPLTGQKKVQGLYGDYMK